MDSLNNFINRKLILDDGCVHDGQNDFFNDGLSLFFTHDVSKDFLESSLLDQLLADGLYFVNNVAHDVELDRVGILAGSGAGGHAGHHVAAARVGVLGADLSSHHTIAWHVVGDLEGRDSSCEACKRKGSSHSLMFN